MQLLEPVLLALAEHHDRGRLEGAAAAGAVQILTRIEGNFREAAAAVVAWSRKGAGFWGALRQALESEAFSRDFDRLRDELAARVAELQLYQLVAARIAVDTVAWRAQDAEADKADREELPAAIVAQVDDEAELGDALSAAGMGGARFKQMLQKHGIAFAEVTASLGRMEAQLALHNEKLDRTLSLLQRGQLKERPDDLMDWADLDVKSDAPVGVGGFGAVYQATWRSSTVAVKLIGEGVALDARTVNKIYREANLMAAIPSHPNVVRYYGVVLQKPHYALVLEFCGLPPLWENGLSIHSLAQARCGQPSSHGRRSQRPPGFSSQTNGFPCSPLNSEPAAVFAPDHDSCWPSHGLLCLGWSASRWQPALPQGWSIFTACVSDPTSGQWCTRT